MLEPVTCGSFGQLHDVILRRVVECILTIMVSPVLSLLGYDGRTKNWDHRKLVINGILAADKEGFTG